MRSVVVVAKVSGAAVRVVLCYGPVPPALVVVLVGASLICQ